MKITTMRFIFLIFVMISFILTNNLSAATKLETTAESTSEVSSQTKLTSFSSSSDSETETTSLFENVMSGQSVGIDTKLV